MKNDIYVIQSSDTGETYVSDGTYACGPLTSSQKVDALTSDLSDWELDSEAPDWVASRDGKMIREVSA